MIIALAAFFAAFLIVTGLTALGLQLAAHLRERAEQFEDWPPRIGQAQPARRGLRREIDRMRGRP